MNLRSRLPICWLDINYFSLYAVGFVVIMTLLLLPPFFIYFPFSVVCVARIPDVYIFILLFADGMEKGKVFASFQNVFKSY